MSSVDDSPVERLIHAAYMYDAATSEFRFIIELAGALEERLRVNVGLVAENKELRRKLRGARCQECAASLEAGL